MISFRISIPQDVARKLAQEIEGELQRKVFPILRSRANELLDEQITGTSAPQKDSPYTVKVDGKMYGDRAAINSARQKVEIVFLQTSINIAVRVMSDIFIQEAGANASPQAWLKRRELASKSNIRMFYGGKGKPVTEITSASEVQGFGPGDFIALAPTWGSQIFANAKKYGALGYMGKAARRIRARIKATGKDSPIRVKAGRSIAVFDRLAPATREDGSVINKTKRERGAWVIYIRYR